VSDVFDMRYDVFQCKQMGVECSQRSHASSHPEEWSTGESDKGGEALLFIVEKTKGIQKRLTNHGISFCTSGQLFL
jgi:hypothetical protein